jgi:cytoskeleton protein RodZ
MEWWETLRRAREQSGLTLDQLATRTKIRRPVLAAIERGDLESAGPPFYARTFVRAYAVEVGIDPVSILRELSASEAPEVPLPPPPPPSPPRLLAAIERAVPLVRAGSRFAPAGMIALAIVLFAVSFTMNRTDDSSAPPAQPSGAIGTGGGSAVSDEAPIDRGNDDRTAATVATPLRLEVRPSGPLWLEATADGDRVVYRLLGADERVTLDAQSELRLRIGDAAAFTYAINGRAGRALGKAGKVVTLRLTPANYAEFVQTG